MVGFHSPNCCGGIALVISGLKGSGIAFTPHSLRRAIENTAAPVPHIEPHALGHGLLQVPDAYGYLRRYDQTKGNLIKLGVSLPGRLVQGKPCRGLYVREPREADRVVQTNVMIKPEWHPDCDNREQVGFELNIEIRCESSWVHVPQYMVVNALGKGFDLKVDPTRLPEGVHFAKVEGYDASHPGRGPLFTVPVTVVRPLKISPESDARLRLDARTYKPGSIDRHFLAVPEGSTWAEISFRTRALEGNHMLVLHALQVLPGTPCSNRNPTELDKYLQLRPNHEVIERVPVLGGLTLELCLCKVLPPAPYARICDTPKSCVGSDLITCFDLLPFPCPFFPSLISLLVSPHLTILCRTSFSLSPLPHHLSISSPFVLNSQWWASLGEAVVDVEVTFHGISATPPLAPPVHLQSACPTPVHVNTPLRPETLSVSAKFSTLRKFYRPSKGGAVLRALGQERDLLPMGRQISELELTYSFEQSEKEAVKVCVALEMLSLLMCKDSALGNLTSG